MIDKQKAQQKGLNIIDSTKQNNPLKSMLEQNFPDTLSEGEVNLKALTMLLGLDPHSNTQGYELTFTGKGLANTLYTTPTDFELSEEIERSKERESTENSIIIGDNLDVLKILKSAYYEKIKMIYIDPPYNTKKDDFTYPDDFREDYKKILREVGLLTIDEEGNEIESKALQTFRNITGSRSHSGWLSFMLPRLKLARDLLKEDGVIFISIDDNEQANLKILCDEIFGEENFCGQITWQTATDNNPTQIAIEHEYVLCYAKSIFHQDEWEIESQKAQLIQNKYDELKNQISDIDELSLRLKQWIRQENGSLRGVSHYCYVDEQGVFYPGNPSNTKPGGYSFDIIHPITNRVCAKPDYGYRFTENTFNAAVQCGDVLWGEDETIIPKIKKRLETATEKLKSVYYEDNRKTTKSLEKLMGAKKIFSNPKSVNFIKTILQFTTKNNENCLILDFFAGSGTTAQAVMELNAEDGGNRHFILVQLPEEIKEDKNKTAYDFVKNELGKAEPKISDITIERVKRAGEKLKSEGLVASSVDIGYRVYSLGEKARLSDEGSIIPHSANITPADIARNLALFAGKPLHIPLEEIVADKLFMCEDILCIVGIDKEVEEKILEDKNRAIFIDGYGTYTLESFLNLNIPNDERVNVVY